MAEQLPPVGGDFPVEARFVPTTEQVREQWMGRMFYGSFVERNEYALGFEEWLSSVAGPRVEPDAEDKVMRACEIGADIAAINAAIDELVIAYSNDGRKYDAWESELFTELSTRRERLRDELRGMG